MFSIQRLICRQPYRKKETNYSNTIRKKIPVHESQNVDDVEIIITLILLDFSSPSVG